MGRSTSKVSNPTKATAASGLLGALSAYGTFWVQQKYGVPAEIGAPVVGGIMAWLGAWAAKLDPTK